MHLNIIMKLGLCTIPHFEDIAPCDILDEDSCCCCYDPNPLHVATPSMQRTLDVLESIDDRCEGGIFACELCMHLCRNLLYWQSC
jgi:hypothetical protein